MSLVTKATLETFLLSIWELIEIALLASDFKLLIARCG